VVVVVWTAVVVSTDGLAVVVVVVDEADIRIKSSFIHVFLFSKYHDK
jgi:hypothetical protein